MPFLLSLSFWRTCAFSWSTFLGFRTGISLRILRGLSWALSSSSAVTRRRIKAWAFPFSPLITSWLHQVPWLLFYWDNTPYGISIEEMVTTPLPPPPKSVLRKTGGRQSECNRESIALQIKRKYKHKQGGERETQTISNLFSPGKTAAAS